MTTHVDTFAATPATRLAAARALYKNTPMSAKEIAVESLNIAAEICIYTNSDIIIEEI